MFGWGLGAPYSVYAVYIHCIWLYSLYLAVFVFDVGPCIPVYTVYSLTAGLYLTTRAPMRPPVFPIGALLNLRWSAEV